VLFTSVAISSTGEYQTAVSSGGGIWISSNYSITWNKCVDILTFHLLWSSVSMSESGQYQTAVASGNGIWISSNFGIDWYNYGSAEISGGFNGTTLFINTLIKGNIHIGQFLIGTNITLGTKIENGNGSIYNINNPQNITGIVTISLLSSLSQYNWSSISVSASGKYQTVVSNNSGIWYSSNYGITWIQYNNILTNNLLWTSVSVSGWNADFITSGKFQVAVSNGGGIWISYNHGIIWHKYNNTLTNNLLWVSVSISANGKYKTAIANYGGIWSSNDIDSSWVKYNDINNINNTLINNESWSSVVISYSGQYQLALSTNMIWMSSNFGVKWYNLNILSTLFEWSSISISNFGNYGTAVSTRGGIWRFFNSNIIDDHFYNSAEFDGYIKENILTVTNVINGNIRIGQLIIAKNYSAENMLYIISNTYITAFRTGIGGTGTYTINISQTTITDVSSNSIPITIHSFFIDKTYFGVIITNTSTDLIRTVIAGGNLNEYGQLNASNTIINGTGTLYWDISGNSTNYGTMTIDNHTGLWNYYLTNNLNVQQLKLGDIKTDIFTVTVANDYDDTDSKNISITINGSRINIYNEPPKIIPSLSDISGNVTTNQILTKITGKIVASDIDLSGSLIWNINGYKFVDSSYGRLSIDGSGNNGLYGIWTYYLSDTYYIKQINIGSVVSDRFTVSVYDYLNGFSNIIVTIHILGEKKKIFGLESHTKKITLSDILNYDFISSSNEKSNSFVITYVSEDTYTLKLGLTEELAVAFDLSYNEIDENVSVFWSPTPDVTGLTSSFSLISKDSLGNESTIINNITINVLPINNPPEINYPLSDISGNIKTNQDITRITGKIVADNINLYGSLVWDIYGNQFIDSSYGRLSIDTSGNTGEYGIWTYDLSNNSKVKQIKIGETKEDRFTISVYDYLNALSNINISIIITGEQKQITVEGTVTKEFTFNEISTCGFDFVNGIPTDTYIITSVGASTYTLKLGLTEELSHAFDLSYNEIDENTNIYWTSSDVFGVTSAFTIISKNVSNIESSNTNTLTIFVTKYNNPPKIIPSLSDISRNITTNQILTKMTGRLVASDIDLSGKLLWNIGGYDFVDSSYGRLSIDSSGNNGEYGIWTYYLSDSLYVQQMNTDNIVIDIFNVAVYDYLDASSSITVSINIIGSQKQIIANSLNATKITFNDISYYDINFNNVTTNSYIITSVGASTYTMKLGLTEELSHAFDLSYNEIDENINVYWTPTENVVGIFPAFNIISKNILNIESAINTNINVNIIANNNLPIIMEFLSEISGTITTNTTFTRITGKLSASYNYLYGSLSWNINGGKFIDGSYGRLSIDTSGNNGQYGIWSYDLVDNSTTRGIYSGKYATDIFSVTVTDYLGFSDTQFVTINIIGSDSVSGFTWALQTSSTNNQMWISVCISNDGQYIVAVSEQNGGVYMSNDYGVSWIQCYPLGFNVYGNWKACAISSNGSTIVIAQFNGYIYKSVDYGVNWIQIWSSISGLKNWISISMSSDGNKISAVSSGSNIYIYDGIGWSSQSTDTSSNPIDKLNWTCVSMSSDGSKIVACAYNDYIYLSSDYGSNWKRLTPTGNLLWKSIIMSSNGAILVSVEYGGYIYISTDYGISWTQTNASFGYWNSISISLSLSGSKIVVSGNDVTNGTYIYISSNYGINWTRQIGANSKLWNSVAISNNGLYIASVAVNDYISVASYTDLFILNSYTNITTTLKNINNKKYLVLQFYSNNTITIRQNIDASYIIVGGGAGGIISTASYGGGGGAGGQVLQGITKLSNGTSYNLVVGNGGNINNNGSSSSFNSNVAYGGTNGTNYIGGIGINGGGNGGNGSFINVSNSTVTYTTGSNGIIIPFSLNINGQTYTHLANGGNGADKGSSGTISINNIGNGGASSRIGGSGIIVVYFSI